MNQPVPPALTARVSRSARRAGALCTRAAVFVRALARSSSSAPPSKSSSPSWRDVHHLAAVRADKVRAETGRDAKPASVMARSTSCGAASGTLSRKKCSTRDLRTASPRMREIPLLAASFMINKLCRFIVGTVASPRRERAVPPIDMDDTLLTQPAKIPRTSDQYLTVILGSTITKTTNHSTTPSTTKEKHAFRTNHT